MTNVSQERRSSQQTRSRHHKTSLCWKGPTKPTASSRRSRKMLALASHSNTVIEPKARSLHFKTRQHWITKVRFVNRSPQLKALHYWRLCLKGPDNSSNLIEAVLALHATNRSNLKGLFVPFRAIILFKNLANLEKAAKDTDIKPLSFSCRMQVTHQGNSLPLDRYSFSQRKKCTCLAGCTSVMITENLHLSLESLWKSSLIHLQSDQGTA